MSKWKECNKKVKTVVIPSVCCSERLLPAKTSTALSTHLNKQKQWLRFPLTKTALFKNRLRQGHFPCKFFETFKNTFLQKGDCFWINLLEFEMCDALRDLAFQMCDAFRVPQWVFFTFFKLYKYYQIAQRITCSLVKSINPI